ncbi:Starch-binding associating with outer membrane [Chitinophaga jiangningensis]|uniref:Starch-binding associating with outer membrane n=1 Tax=Chitinophaga jiangningensis TaxID=1419482 RepID=A0A1M7C5U8_9BACT|nr:SusD/RagB family nutrient-binding outer membrane lipoprotein [Chitinophaga jiangningensis]SHL62682.1 Starch-binding associating with outer membrane [Chitinophaga jiangningensis]
MRKIFLIIGISVAVSSCKKWLDVNKNPNTATSDVPTADMRLAPLISQFSDCYESSGTRASFLTQQIAVVYPASNAATNNNWNLTRWYSNTSSANWPWQCWYVNTAVNVDPLITAAQKVEAWHYIGAAKVIKGWGFGTLADFYGMLPYDEFAMASTYTPKFDDGEYIQGKILPLLDEAIADLKKTQGPAAPLLSKADILNNGSVDKWIRLAYGLKARFLLHTSKKGSFNAQAVLDALANAPQTDDQSSIRQYVDEGPTVTSTAKEALQYSNTGTTVRFTKLYIDYLTNNYQGAPTGANNMRDPRMDSILPRMQVDTGWLFTKGMDMTSDLPKTGPSNPAYNSSTNKFANGDSVYIPLRKNPYAPTAGQRVLSTGSWYTKRDAKGLLLTNAEMRFIEAEVKFRQGDANGALTAYKAGIRSHMNLLGILPAKTEQFLQSTSVVQSAANLTLSHIMIQKYIALSFSVETWADMRRNNYCADGSGVYNLATGVYKGYQRPSHVYIEGYPAPTDYPRRFAVASYEINFNIDQVLKANPNAAKPAYLSEPVWWDKP